MMGDLKRTLFDLCGGSQVVVEAVRGPSRRGELAEIRRAFAVATEPASSAEVAMLIGRDSSTVRYYRGGSAARERKNLLAGLRG
jgi:hypothetical protein